MIDDGFYVNAVKRVLCILILYTFLLLNFVLHNIYSIERR